MKRAYAALLAAEALARRWCPTCDAPAGSLCVHRLDPPIPADWSAAAPTTSGVAPAVPQAWAAAARKVH